ncbi:uncharacterized protein ACNS7B_019448 isoform 1-T1 [Menidia menidia]
MEGTGAGRPLWERSPLSSPVRHCSPVLVPFILHHDGGSTDGWTSCADGSPSDATLHGKMLVYRQKAAIDPGINLRGEGGSMVLALFQPGSGLVLAWFWPSTVLTHSSPSPCRSVLQAVLRESGPELRSGGGGQRVGTMLPMLYPGITSHLQMSHKRDPTGYF